jgi:3-isopropylmalate/(R)-2-methylmalate dehydratase small subunit
MITGKVWKYGDHVNTDLIIPGRYLDNYDPQHLAAHALEDLDLQFARGVKTGDIILAGRNFGCGSSREQAPQALRSAGVSAVIAGSVARIFYRNAINVGLPIIICPEAGRILNNGDIAELDLVAGTLRNRSMGGEVQFTPLPPFLMDILSSGGLVPYMKGRLGPRSP